MKSVEKDFSHFFRVPIAELNKLNKEEANTQKKKKQVVIDLAMRFEQEEDVAVDKICRIIIKYLQVELEPRTIREYLPEKYKSLPRVINAKKQKSKRPEPLEIHNLAAVPPLNQEEVIDYKETLLIDTKDKISIDQEGGIQPLSTVDISLVDTDVVELLSLQAEPQLQKNLEIKALTSSIDKCLECPKKDIKILELTEIIEKSNQFTTAEKSVTGKIPYDNKEAVEDILEFECYKIYREVSEYVGSFFSSGNSARIHFCGRINATTRKLLSFDLGKLDQYRNINEN
jgi:hypothetical protein